MPTMNLSKSDLPFFLDGNGNITVQAEVPTFNQPLPPSADQLLSVAFGASGDQAFSFGKPGSLQLGIDVGAKAKLLALRKTTSGAGAALLQEYKLTNYFDSHPDDLILALLLDASADVSAAGSFRYELLKANARLEAGGNAGYAYLCNFPADTHVGPLLRDFFAGVRLPAHLTAPPQAGEVISFNYGGYLKLGAGLSAGYEIKGTPDFSIGQLQLAEHYKLSVIGKLALDASLAGSFAVEVRADDKEAGWARVVVRKHRSSSFKIAADVKVNADISTPDLPATPHDFLGAVFGVNVKNWLNVVEQIQRLTDLGNLQQELDTLAKRFISEWTGKAFDELAQTGFDELLAKVNKVVDSYHNLENRAISLFDRYFDRLDGLTAKLNQLIALTSWNQLRGDLDPMLWNIVNQLTDGDPLTWALGKIKLENGQEIPSLPELKRRVQQTLDLIQGHAHQHLRDFIKLAKEQFPLHRLLTELAKVDSLDKLKAIADNKIGGLVERLLGKGISALSDSEAGKFIAEIHTLLGNVDQFEKKLYAKFVAATKNSFSFQLHAEYSRARERDALLDLSINLTTNEGRELMQLAGRGDFAEALASYRPDLVRVNRGRLTHRITKQSKFSVNIIGWHGGKKGAWQYQSLRSLILNTEQQIVPGENGRLTIFTTMDLEQESEQQTKTHRQTERMYTNFLFRFIGESTGVLKFDEQNQQYLIDTITGIAAKYRLSFADTNTTQEELAYYLSFADEFGLTSEGATLAELLPLLPQTAGNFGAVEIEYEARYTKEGLASLFKDPFTPASAQILRQLMRKIVLGNYLRRKGALADAGWCYWSQRVRNAWEESNRTNVSAFRSSTKSIELNDGEIDTSPFAGQATPTHLALPATQRQLLDTLYQIEDKFVNGCQALSQLVQRGDKKSPAEFETALGAIGAGLSAFDRFDDGVNTIFAVLDQLIKMQLPTEQVRVSSLSLVSKLTDQAEFHKRFIAQPEGVDLIA